jgi:hypothetical protein
LDSSHLIFKDVPTPPPLKKLLRAKVLYDHHSDDPEHQSFSKDEIILVTERGDPGSWSTSTGGLLFPTDFVEFLSDDYVRADKKTSLPPLPRKS